MDEETPHIEVHAVHVSDAPALYELDYSFETDLIYTLCVRNRMVQNGQSTLLGDGLAFAFELKETQVDPPYYKDYRAHERSSADVEARLQNVEGGFVARANGELAGAILLNVEEVRSIVQIQDLTVGRQFRRYGVGSLLLSCAADWARNRKCWAIVLETQNTNYPAIQFYLRNGLDIWSINQNFYPPGASAHEVAIFMGKRLSNTPEE